MHPMRASALVLTAALFLCPVRTAAQDVAGSLMASALVADGDAGAGATLDLFVPLEWFRIGGFFGVGVIPAERDARNRVMMPFGVSLGAHFALGELALSLRARGGLWGGATQEVKLTAGGFFGGGASIGWQASPEVSLFVGVEIWGILGAGETWCVPVSVGLEWGPAPPAAPEASDEDAAVAGEDGA